ncbi:MAG: NADH-quinone oxidoreductase subunit B [Armatimonadetes bacterium]|nr:NADH-quinone oxidoreductase subunit B [Armatimonadota bacterium]
MAARGARMGLKDSLGRAERDLGESWRVPVPGGSVLIAPVDRLAQWARRNSLWSLTFGLSCCAIEMMASAGPKYDLDRFGMFFRATPRQADVMIVAGWVSVKMAPFIRRLYDQMPEPKYVIAMGGCASAGGPYRDSITIVKGVDRFVPVDVYVYGCPPRPEGLIYGIVKLQEQIRSERAMTRRGQTPPAREPIVVQA